MKQVAKNRIAQLVYVGAPATSVALVTSMVTDPVNLTKLTVMGIFAVSLLAVFFVNSYSSRKFDNKMLLVLSSIFLSSSLISVVMSDSSFSQSFYGVYGRSTGFLAYCALIIFMIGAAEFNQRIWFRKLIIGFMSVGVLNVLYCAWVLLFGDFIGWSNPYGEILGFFGNPNFIGAFLGMFVVGTSSLLLKKGLSARWRLSGFVLIALASYEIIESQAVQGIVVSAGGLSLLLLIFLWSKRVHPVILVSSFIVFSVLAMLSIMGALQKGPFTFIYKRSVSLRGTYWNSGLEMGLQNPLTGVGMDSYGDWYRRARPPIALIDTPGISVVTNAAHNVVIDIFAYGGFPLFLSYLGILFLGLKAVLSVLRVRNGYDPIFTFLALVWVCYQIQSLISINQIGLAIWGWVLTGALIGYQKLIWAENQSDSNGESSKNLSTSRNKRASQSDQASVSLATGFGVLAGLIFYLPPLASDVKWFDATKSGNLAKIEASLTPSYFNPSNSQRYIQAISLLQNNNLNDLALKYAKEAVAFNPDDFSSWRALYLLTTNSEPIKQTALNNLKRLDPLNPDVTAP
jgi:O-antigen ligase